MVEDFLLRLTGVFLTDWPESTIFIHLNWMQSEWPNYVFYLLRFCRSLLWDDDHATHKGSYEGKCLGLYVRTNGYQSLWSTELFSLFTCNTVMYCITLYTYYHTVYGYFSMHLIACVGTGSIITEWNKKKNKFISHLLDVINFHDYTWLANVFLNGTHARIIKLLNLLHLQYRGWNVVNKTCTQGTEQKWVCELYNHILN